MARRVNASVVPEYDLIVVGAGAGGMVTALCAAHLGLRVLLCEASDQAGGTTALSAGTVWIPGNTASYEAGRGDCAADARRYLDGVIGRDDPRGLRDAFLESAPQAIDFLAQRTEVRFVPAGLHPDYLQVEGAALAGRALTPLPYDGRALGDDFGRVRPPLPDFTILGGMMLGKRDVQALIGRYRARRDFLHTLRILGRHALDRLTYPRGTRLVMGNALVARCLASLRAARVDLRYRSRLAGLLHADGAVFGATFETEGGVLACRARHGVVLACGGIGHHAGLRARLSPGTAHWDSLLPEEIRGAGLQHAMAIGARLDEHPGSFFWQPVSRVPARDGYRLFPHLYLDRAKPGLIAVNGAGMRFTNEADSYHHFAASLWPQMGQTAPPAFLVCDADFIRRYGLGIIPPGKRSTRRYEARGYVLRSDTLHGLALKIGVPADALALSVARHNTCATEGKDGELGKGGSALNRFNGDPRHTPNPCLGPIRRAPFHALPIWPADAGSSTGLATDCHGRVLNQSGEIVPGLFAAGNDMASPMRGSYPGPGITLGPALAFGYRIARHIAAQNGS